VRVYVTPFGSGVALELARSLEDVDGALAETRVRLIEIALAGVLVAAALGALVARAVLAPVARLGETVEEVTRTRDLTRRVGARANDELGRLARSFDGMLAALEMSLRSQRQLVADASHELRTPLTSLRTNLELLERGQPTDEDDRTQLLHDLVAQMERLSTLVADLIDLAHLGRDERGDRLAEVGADDAARGVDELAEDVLSPGYELRRSSERRAPVVRARTAQDRPGGLGEGAVHLARELVLHDDVDRDRRADRGDRDGHRDERRHAKPEAHASLST